MIISIDGASRRNGKPDCVAAGGVFISHEAGVNPAASFKTEASNQQGELLGLISALTVFPKYATTDMTDDIDQDIFVVTDSEYLYNAMTKDWIGNWERKGWITAEGNPVKNQDLWKQISELYAKRLNAGFEIHFYHIKGHLISLGKVTAAKILEADPTGQNLYNLAWNKYDEAEIKKPDNFEAAKDLFQRNHGFLPPEDTFKEFVVMNTVADYIAGTYIDKKDLELRR